MEVRNRQYAALEQRAAVHAVAGRTVIGRLRTVLRTKPDVGTATAYARAERTYLGTLRTWAARLYRVYTRPADDEPGEES